MAALPSTSALAVALALGGGSLLYTGPDGVDVNTQKGNPVPVDPNPFDTPIGRRAPGFLGIAIGIGMIVAVCTPSMRPKLLAEFTGTFLLTFTIGCNHFTDSGIWDGTSIACMLMAAVYAFGGISGANYNPAVTVALWINGDMEGMDTLRYISCQIGAGVAAGFSYYALFEKSFQLQPGKGFDEYDAGAVEFLYTFVLCFVVLNVAALKKGCQNWFGLAIGFVIVAGAYGGGAISGGCFNPAVAFGIDVSQPSRSPNSGLELRWCLVYTVCELAGAFVAALLFKVVRPNGGEESEDSPLSAKLVAELIGTYVLVLTVGLNVLGKSEATAFSVAASLMCMIYALGDVSGAHFNPAVTVALTIHKVKPPAEAGMYVGAQVVGGCAAAFTCAGIYSGETIPVGPGTGYDLSQAFIAELLFTSVLVLVVLCAAIKPKTKSDDFFGLAIGSCVTVGGNAIGAISGGCLNPAVAIALGTFGPFPLTNVATYSLAEILGGIIAAVIVMITHAEPDTSGHHP